MRPIRAEPASTTEAEAPEPPSRHRHETPSGNVWVWTGAGLEAHWKRIADGKVCEWMLVEAVDRYDAANPIEAM